MTARAICHRHACLAVALLLAACNREGAPAGARSEPAGGTRGPSGAGAAQNRPVTVTVAPVARKDVPVHLEGLGTVVAYKTVTVRTRVEGQLQKVSFREGQEVKTGMVLAQIDPRPFQIQLHLAEAALARDHAQLRGSRLNLERYAEVRKEKLIAQQQVDDQRTSVEQLEANVKADQAQVESARLQLDYARITSPIDGVTGVRLVDPGNIVHVSDPNGIVVITQLDPISVLFTLPQDDLVRVSEQMALSPLAVTALSREGTSELGTGKVELIDNQINVGTGTIRLKAVFPNPKRTLWPNQFVKARLLLATRKGVLVVPAVAVQRGPRGPFAYVVGQDGKAVSRPIEVAELAGEVALIARGLEAGEQVVTDGQSLLRPGATVLLKAPEPAPGAARAPTESGQAQGPTGNPRPRP